MFEFFQILFYTIKYKNSLDLHSLATSSPVQLPGPQPKSCLGAKFRGKLAREANKNENDTGNGKSITEDVIKFIESGPKDHINITIFKLEALKTLLKSEKFDDQIQTAKFIKKKQEGNYEGYYTCSMLNRVKLTTPM